MLKFKVLFVQKYSYNTTEVGLQENKTGCSCTPRTALTEKVMKQIVTTYI